MLIFKSWSRRDEFPPACWGESFNNQHDCEVHIRRENDSASQLTWMQKRHEGFDAGFHLSSLRPVASRLVTLHITNFQLHQCPQLLGWLLSEAAQLRSLSIDAQLHFYDNWEWSSPPPPSPLNLRQLTLNNFCVCSLKGWDAWKDLVVWENLQEAGFTCPSVLLQAGSRLHGLRKLEISCYNWQQDLDSSWFVRYIPPIDPRERHSDKISIQAMLRILGPGLRELRFSGLIEAFEPDCVSHIQSLRRLWLVTLKYPKGREQALQTLAANLSLSKVNHPQLKEVTVQLPYTAIDVDQVI
jgi:hypothetical protein